MTRRLVIPPEIVADVQAIHAWWRTNRPLAPNLFIGRIPQPSSAGRDRLPPRREPGAPRDARRAPYPVHGLRRFVEAPHAAHFAAYFGDSARIHVEWRSRACCPNAPAALRCRSVRVPHSRGRGVLHEHRQLRSDPRILDRSRSGTTAADSQRVDSWILSSDSRWGATVSPPASSSGSTGRQNLVAPRLSTSGALTILELDFEAHSVRALQRLLTEAGSMDRRLAQSARRLRMQLASRTVGKVVPERRVGLGSVGEAPTRLHDPVRR